MQKIRKVTLGLIVCFLAQGCANYGLKNNLVTTTIKLDGTQIKEEKICELSITSIREVKATDVKLSKSCALRGSAESLGANERLIDLMTTVIKKVP